MASFIHIAVSSFSLHLTYNMASRFAILSLALGASKVLGQQFEDFDFCQEEFCPEGSCPFYGNFNMEFPECNIYSTEGLSEFGYEGTGAGYVPSKSSRFAKYS